MPLSVIDEVRTMTSNFVTKPHTGEILATGVTFEEYLERFAGIHCELVDGTVIKPSSPSLGHQNLKFLSVFAAQSIL